jgi:hypothetical protein
MNVIDQKLVEVELGGFFLFDRENGHETQDGFIHTFV